MPGPLVLLANELGPSTPDAVMAYVRSPAVVVPTASAFEHPHRLAAHIVAWLATHGVTGREVVALNRRDALDADHVTAVGDAATIVVTGGTAMHARSVLKDTPLWHALVDAHKRGASVIASGAGATVLADPMADSRGGGLTLGLGLLSPVAVLAGSNGWPASQVKRMRQLAGANVIVATIADGGALVHDGTTWTAAGSVELHRTNRPIDLSELPLR